MQHFQFEACFGAGRQCDEGEVQPASAQVVGEPKAGATVQLDLDVGMVSGERGEDPRDADLGAPMSLHNAEPDGGTQAPLQFFDRFARRHCLCERAACGGQEDPAGVGESTRWDERSNSRVPRSRSSAWIVAETADWTT